MTNEGHSHGCDQKGVRRAVASRHAPSTFPAPPAPPHPMSLLDDLVRRCSRALSTPERTDLARALLILDVALALTNPVYAGFAERRHTGRWGRRFGLSLWIQSWRYVIARLCSPRSALFTMDFGSQPYASASAKERKDWITPGSCAGCTTKACCKMKAPWGTEEACPLLQGDTCRVYDGLAWRVGSCGRFPEAPARITEYGCPRFESADTPRFAALAEEKRSAGHRVRLPVVSSRAELRD